MFKADEPHITKPVEEIKAVEMIGFIETLRARLVSCRERSRDISRKRDGLEWDLGSARSEVKALHVIIKDLEREVKALKENR